MTGKNLDFCLKKYSVQLFLCSLTPVQVLLLPGQALIGTGFLSHTGLLQTGPTGYVALTYGCYFPRLDRECILGLVFTHGFIFSELPEMPAILPHLRIFWTRSIFHWYDYLAAIFVPSLGATDVMLQVDVLTNYSTGFTRFSKNYFSP